MSDVYVGVRTWMGAPPQACDICKCGLAHTFVDGKTVRGPWGIMCLKCHGAHGVGLGTGRGQRYVFVGTRFVKEEG